MHKTDDGVPRLSAARARDLVSTQFGIEGTLTPLPSYSDQNFRVETGDGHFVLRIANATDVATGDAMYDSGESPTALEAQMAALVHLATQPVATAVPRIVPTTTGAHLITVENAGLRHAAHLLTYLEGTMLANALEGKGDRSGTHDPLAVDRSLLESVGQLVADVDRALADFHHPGADRDVGDSPFVWDLARSKDLIHKTGAIAVPRRRWLVERAFEDFDAALARWQDALPRSVIHNDANEHNVVVAEGTDRHDDDDQPRASGLIDFGDLVRTHRVFGAAIAAAYASFGHACPFDAICAVIAGYHRQWPLATEERAILLPAVRARLATTVTMAAIRRRERPENAYLSISESAAWESLERLVGLDDAAATSGIDSACGVRSDTPTSASAEADRILAVRSRHLGPNLSLSYRHPLEITRGFMQYLFDAEGRPYVDGVNNVCHVGHSHPRVVEAIHRQAARLNTNTRYLHANLADYAERLTATLPAPLEVCFFVCTGSEANDLALRLARTYTGRHGVITVDGAYHGHTGRLIEISPYKFAGKGGTGAPDHVAVAQMPDVYRNGRGIADGAHGRHFAADVSRAADDLEATRGGDARNGAAGHGVAAFIAESLLGCGGQVVPAEGYFRHAFAHVRERGAVCILDEVQVGFGRVGDGFWAFESAGVVPDIVTLGKPIGNGHPMAAVITTRAIADAFNTGMEYFNTFGGNPVSMAAGLAVLDVIEDEALVDHARQVGAQLLDGLGALAHRHDLIGDVRGRGLFIGVELVTDHDTLAPAADAAAAIVETMKSRGILLSTDGPLHNVLKIKPPLPFAPENAEQLIAELDRALTGYDSSSKSQK